jgi:hypothetical protein
VFFASEAIVDSMTTWLFVVGLLAFLRSLYEILPSLLKALFVDVVCRSFTRTVFLTLRAVCNYSMNIHWRSSTAMAMMMTMSWRQTFLS